MKKRALLREAVGVVLLTGTGVVPSSGLRNTSESSARSRWSVMVRALTEGCTNSMSVFWTVGLATAVLARLKLKLISAKMHLSGHDAKSGSETKLVLVDEGKLIQSLLVRGIP